MVGIAQLVERQVVALEVMGSSPIAHPENCLFLIGVCAMLLSVRRGFYFWPILKKTPEMTSI